MFPRKKVARRVFMVAILDSTPHTHTHTHPHPHPPRPSNLVNVITFLTKYHRNMNNTTNPGDLTLTNALDISNITFEAFLWPKFKNAWQNLNKKYFRRISCLCDYGHDFEIQRYIVIWIDKNALFQNKKVPWKKWLKQLP